LKSVDFQGGWAVKEAKVTDRGLEILASLCLPNLQSVSLGYNDNITDHGLTFLATMSPLAHVGVQYCSKITDEGLAYLAEHAIFESLSLNGCTGITDAGLGFLTANRHLKYLWLGDCPNITQEAVDAAQSAMPWAWVVKDDAVLEGRPRASRRGWEGSR
jgi:hypothetical protein